MSDPIGIFGERLSDAPTTQHAIKSIDGTTAVTLAGEEEGFNYGRGIYIIEEWTSADDLLILYAGDTDFSTIPNGMATSFARGAILPFAIKEFKSSDVNETNFKIAILR